MELEPFPPISTSPESTPASQHRLNESERSSPRICVAAMNENDAEDNELFDALSIEGLHGDVIPHVIIDRGGQAKAGTAGPHRVI